MVSNITVEQMEKEWYKPPLIKMKVWQLALITVVRTIWFYGYFITIYMIFVIILQLS